MKLSAALISIILSLKVKSVPIKEDKNVENYHATSLHNQTAVTCDNPQANSVIFLQDQNLSRQDHFVPFSDHKRGILKRLTQELKSFVRGNNLEVNRFKSQEERLKMELLNLEKTLEQCASKQELESLKYAQELSNTMIDSSAKFMYLRNLGGPGAESVSCMIGVILGAMTLQNSNGTLDLLLENCADQVLELWRVMAYSSKKFASLSDVSAEVRVMFAKYYTKAKFLVDELVGQITVPFQ